jgi:hypothetical protein
VALQEFECHFDLMADKLMNEAVLFVANRRRPRRILPGPDSGDSAAAAASTTTTSTTATTSAEAMDVEAAKVDTIGDVDSNDADDDDVDSGGEEATAYRLAEVEFYYWGGALRDVFTHRDEAQRESGRWYFHRDVSDRTKYRTGNFKGLDITFGNGGRDVRTNTHTRHTTAHTLTRTRTRTRTTHRRMCTAGCSSVRSRG